MQLTKRHIQNVVLFKVALTVSFAAVYFLPPIVAAPLTVASNTFWLWRVK